MLIDKTSFAFFSTYMTLYIDEKQNKWFRETNSELSIEIEEILYQQRSKYQDILVFKR